MNLTPEDIEDRKMFIQDPKSGNEAEVAFLPQKAADRLKKDISDKGIKSEESIFPITYAAARVVVKTAAWGFGWRESFLVGGVFHHLMVFPGPLMACNELFLVIDGNDLIVSLRRHCLSGLLYQDRVRR